MDGFWPAVTFIVFFVMVAEVIKSVFGTKTSRYTSAKLSETERAVKELTETVRRLQERVETVEAVVTGAQFQASQRISQALEAGRVAPEVSSSAAVRQVVQPSGE